MKLIQTHKYHPPLYLKQLGFSDISLKSYKIKIDMILFQLFNLKHYANFEEILYSSEADFLGANLYPNNL